MSGTRLTPDFEKEKGFMEVTLSNLNMGEFSAADAQEIASIQQGIDLQQSSFVTGFGDSGMGLATIESSNNMMEDSPVTALAAKIAQITGKLTDADPRITTEKPSWWQKFTGSAVEKKVRYQQARKSLDTLLADAEKLSGQVEAVIDALDKMIGSHQAESRTLRLHIAAGRLYLHANLDAGKPNAAEMSFENQRERFSRKLTNLAALLASHEMSYTQLKLTRAQAVDLIDRFHEVSRVLVPVWRQHTLALLNNTRIDPETLAAANRAHEALMTSLSKMKMTEEQ